MCCAYIDRYVLMNTRQFISVSKTTPVHPDRRQFISFKNGHIFSTIPLDPHKIAATDGFGLQAYAPRKIRFEKQEFSSQNMKFNETSA